MLSRIAESLYWLSRYLERADNTARLMEINLLYLVEAEERLPEASLWRPVLSISDSEAAYARCYDGVDITAQHVIQFMTADPANPNTIHASLRGARENARVVRDRISKEMWQAMNELWLTVDARLLLPSSNPSPASRPITASSIPACVLSTSSSMSSSKAISPVHCNSPRIVCSAPSICSVRERWSRSRQAIAQLSAHLAHHTADTVLKGGLHEFLEGFLAGTAIFNEALQADYFATHVEA